MCECIKESRSIAVVGHSVYVDIGPLKGFNPDTGNPVPSGHGISVINIGRNKTKSVYITFQFCPFCGQKLLKEPTNER